MKLRKQAEVLLNLGESPAAIVGRMKTFLGFDLTPKTASPEPAVNHASPDSVVNNASHEFAVNYDPAEPAVKHAPLIALNHAKSGTPMDCAKTTFAIKAVKRKCELEALPEKSEPENLSNVSVANSSFLEIFDDVQNTNNGAPGKVEDYNFGELSEFYRQVFFLCTLSVVSMLDKNIMVIQKEKRAVDDPDCTMKRKRKRIEGPHLHTPFSLLGDQSMTMIF